MVINSLLEQIFRTGNVYSADEKAIKAFPASIDRSLAEAIYKLIRKNKLQKTMEVGMAFGLSSLAICQALRDNGIGHHIAIDPLERTYWKSIGMLNLKRAALDDLVELQERESHSVLPQFLKQGQTFEFIFIDGSHLFDDVMLDFFFAQRLVVTGGWICMDDMWMPAVATAFAFIKQNLRDILIVEQTERYSILKPAAKKIDREWNHFVKFC